MSKDITWFKFYPSEWMMGRIQRQPDKVQLAFMRLMCKYWHKECVLTIEEAEFDCGEKEIQELLSSKIIHPNEGYITIKFLDEQMELIEATSDKNRKNAQVRWQNNGMRNDATALGSDATALRNDATALRNDATAMRIDAEKRREEKIRKEKKRVYISETKKVSLQTKCRDVFLEYYKTQYNTEYYYTAKCAGSLKQLIGKIKYKVKESELPETDEAIAEGFEIFIRAINDKFILNNFSIPMINSKFNECYGQLTGKRSESGLTI